MDDIQNKLLAIFEGESREHLEFIREKLAPFQKNPRHLIDEKALEEAFRHAHSLKGAARAIDLTSVEILAHHLESLFSRIREGKLRFTPEVLKIIHLALDMVEDLDTALIKKMPMPDPTEILREIEITVGMEHGKEDPESPIPPHEPEESAEPAPLLPDETLETVRITTGSLDRMIQTNGEFLTETAKQRRIGAELKTLVQDIQVLEKEWEHATPQVNQDRLKSLRKHGKELLGLQRRNAWTQKQLVETLRKEVLAARMVPASDLMQGLRKMVRDVATQERKSVDFQISGMEVRADRMVLQTLKDPLIHLLRNAVVHGIESSETRSRRNKSAEGVMSLALESTGSRLKVTLQDDGDGIDSDKVTELAVQKGVLTASEAEKISPREKLFLIFQAGISTTEKVSTLSGRGLGLTIVQEAITKLQGDISVDNRPGEGCAFTLSVPLAIATHRLLLVKHGDHLLAVPYSVISHLLQVSPDRIQTVEGKKILTLDDSPVPVAGLAQLIGEKETVIRVSQEKLTVFLCRIGGKKLAVVVDQIRGELDGVVKEILPPAGNNPLFLGGVLLEDGSVCLVANPMPWMTAYQRDLCDWKIESRDGATEEKLPTILVVDDSITTRTLEKSILEANGYRVLIAVDGIEALKMLRENATDLVVADLQMPRMDGFGLIREMKADANLKTIPVIIVSSVETEADREKGLHLGAEAYIVKRKFSNRELLETVRQLL